MEHIKLVNPILNYHLSDIEYILYSKEITNGEWVKNLESQIKKIHNVKYAVAVSSGTTACMILLKSLPIKIKTVAMPAFTWGSIKNIVNWLGYKIKWVDINEKTWMADFKRVKADVYFPTFTFGNVDAYVSYKPNIIFDAAHCTGNKAVGGQGFGSFFSFSPAKGITGIEGGMIITNNKTVYENVLKLRTIMGRMSEINAYIACCNLYYSESIQLIKKRIFEFYKNKLGKRGEFQTMVHSNYNEIGFVPKAYLEAQSLKLQMEDYMDVRKRYECFELNDMYSNSYKIYDNIIMLPGNNMEEAKRVAELIEGILNE